MRQLERLGLHLVPYPLSYCFKGAAEKASTVLAVGQGYLSDRIMEHRFRAYKY